MAMCVIAVVGAALALRAAAAEGDDQRLAERMGVPRSSSARFKRDGVLVTPPSVARCCRSVIQDRPRGGRKQQLISSDITGDISDRSVMSPFLAANSSWLASHSLDPQSCALLFSEDSTCTIRSGDVIFPPCAQ
jgi:hypothetical protein